MKRFLLLPVLCFAIPLVAWAQQPDSLLRPDPVVLKQTLLDLCTKAHADILAGPTQSKIKDREIVRFEREDYLLPPSPKTTDKRSVYVVQVAERSDWYHESLTYIFVLFLDAGQLTPVLVYVGGFGETETETCFELISINDGAHYPQPSGSPVGIPLKTLLIRDGSSGTGYHQLRVLLFRFDQKTRRMATVFDQLVHFGARPQPYQDFESTIAFKRSPKNSLDDIVVTTQWLVSVEPGGELGGPGSTVDTRESVFHWNGDKYEGQMNVPEQTKLGFGDHWKPGAALEDLVKPLPDPPQQKK